MIEGMHTAMTVTVDPTGKVGLPAEVLQASHIHPGMELVVIAEVGKIILMDRKQALSERMKTVDRELRARLRKALKAGGQTSFFAGLSLDEYLALSVEEEKILWDSLSHEAEQEVKVIERDIPPHFRPAGQGHSARGTTRHRSR
jgi:bifunctional DNA-binding transcriptional regulator/antitoxin component of YhaV-PrlF toxin-antitoxin module